MSRLTPVAMLSVVPFKRSTVTVRVFPSALSTELTRISLRLTPTVVHWPSVIVTSLPELLPAMWVVPTSLCTTSCGSAPTVNVAVFLLLVRTTEPPGRRPVRNQAMLPISRRTSIHTRGSHLLPLLDGCTSLCLPFSMRTSGLAIALDATVTVIKGLLVRSVQRVQSILASIKVKSYDFIGSFNRVSRYLGHFCVARMQHEGRRVNVRRRSSSRRGDATFTRFHRMTRSRFSLPRDDPLFYVGLEVSSPPCYTWR